MTIDLTQKIVSLKGESYKLDDKDLTLGHVISEALVLDQNGGKMKLYALAQKAYSNESMEVDVADLSLIKKAVEATTAYNKNTVIIGQALTLLEQVK